MPALASPRLPLLHPATLIATWFGSGLLPKAPGTWGSLAALPVAALVAWLAGPWGLAAATLAVLAVGLWACRVYVGESGRDDPGEIVVDEVAGQWLALVPLAVEPAAYGVAFLAFRLFDIAKIWPANWIDRRVKGPWGIMADDLVAGLYAGAATYVLWLWLG